jgi:hypothetical protein
MIVSGQIRSIGDLHALSLTAGVLVRSPNPPHSNLESKVPNGGCAFAAPKANAGSLSTSGVVRSFTEQYLDSCGVFKDAVLSILATIAKQERIRLSERVHAGLAKARRAGRIGGRPSLVVDRDRTRTVGPRHKRTII